MIKKLKECPFCGSKNVDVYNDQADPRDYIVTCADCGASGPACFHVEKCIDSWNLRNERTCRKVMAHKLGVGDVPVCSECRRELHFKHRDQYCPRCGAKVVEE